MYHDLDLLLKLRGEIPSCFAEETPVYRGRTITSDQIIAYFDSSIYRYLDLIGLIDKQERTKVLDIGISYGFCDIVLKVNYGLDVIGTDVAQNTPGYCRLCSQYGIEVVPFEFGPRPLPFSDETFDTVILAGLSNTCGCIL